MALKARIKYKSGSFLAGVTENIKPVSDAVVTAIKGAGEQAKIEGRASMARGGFSTRWQNSLRLTVFENNGIDAAARLLHRVPYAGVFEQNGTISGKPTMWVPLPQVQKLFRRGREGGRGKTTTPDDIDALLPAGQKLFPRRGKGGKMLLFAMLEVGVVSGAVQISKLTQRQLKIGSTTRSKKRRLIAVPLFVQEKTVRVKDRSDVTEAVERARDGLADRYFQALKV